MDPIASIWDSPHSVPCTFPNLLLWLGYFEYIFQECPVFNLCAQFYLHELIFGLQYVFDRYITMCCLFFFLPQSSCVFINACPFAGYCNCHGLVHRYWHLQRSSGCKLQAEGCCVHYAGGHWSKAFSENVWESRHAHWTPQGMSQLI